MDGDRAIHTAMAATNELPTPVSPKTAAGASAPPALETIASAAMKLGMDAASLRRHCFERGERVGDCIVALLDGGVVAFKFGGRWRVRLPRAESVSAEVSAMGCKS